MSGAALPSLPDPDRVLFASDMHLDDRHPALVERFLTELAARLQATPASGSTLFLLGDLFEYWIGDDAVGPAAQRLAALLHGFTGQGGRVFLMHGNRDFLIDSPLPGQPGHTTYSQHCGATLLPDPTVVEIGGQRVLLSHGDPLCTDDVPYSNGVPSAASRPGRPRCWPAACPSALRWRNHCVSRVPSSNRVRPCWPT